MVGVGSVEMVCLRQVVKGKSRNFPIYVGFLKPSDLVRVAVAPAFKRDASHREIATRVLEPPVSDWQRPLEQERVNRIAEVFDDADSLMPNPVLLSENIDAGNLSPKTVAAGDGSATDMWSVSLQVPRDGDPMPLWILDGQHRINGLAASKQKDNFIPVVLLANGTGNPVYSGRDFAHLFAQVTVTAKGLNAIHEEWLTYSYSLDSYASTEPDSDAHRSAFEAVAYLCGSDSFERVDSNPWRNGIEFNPEDEAAKGTALTGFRYDSVELKTLLLRHYYGSATATGEHVEPEELAEELARAYLALKQVVKGDHDDSVFFGKSPNAHKVMQDAFLIGVLQRIARMGAPDSWLDHLRHLKFHETDWDFSGWTTTRGGNAGNTSRKVAEAVMTTVMTTGSLPEGIDNLADYLNGNRCGVAIVCRRLKENGRPDNADKVVINLTNGDKITRDIGDRTHLKVIKPGNKMGADGTSINIGKIDVFDGQSKGRPRRFAEATGAGLTLNDAIGDGEVQLVFSLEHYGAAAGEASLRVKFELPDE